MDRRLAPFFSRAWREVETPPLLVRLTTCVAFLLAAGAAAAAPCTWETAASRYGVNAQVLYAIAQQESSLDPRAVNRNHDGSYDLGLTQINSRWLPHLSKFGITSEALLDPCVNLNVGAYILALSMSRHGNTWQAIGAYHSSTPARRDRYAQSIYHRLHARASLPGTAGAAPKH